VATLKQLKSEAYETAVDSLARYKFMMFGYWAAIWTYLNQIDKVKEPNPFRQFVELARAMQHKGDNDDRHTGTDNFN